MKVKTDYVPESASRYITQGKEYRVVETEGNYAGNIIDDTGDEIFIHFQESAHLNGHSWQIVEDTDMELSITSECDDLREEMAVLEAENRRLHNEIHELRKVPGYPEAAVRAVWEHGAEGGETPFSIGVSADGIWELNKPEVARIFTEAMQKGEGDA